MGFYNVALSKKCIATKENNADYVYANDLVIIAKFSGFKNFDSQMVLFLTSDFIPHG